MNGLPQERDGREWTTELVDLAGGPLLSLHSCVGHWRCPYCDRSCDAWVLDRLSIHNCPHCQKEFWVMPVYQTRSVCESVYLCSPLESPDPEKGDV